MSFREAVARFICPELGNGADKWWRISVDIQEMKQWLGYDFPIIEVALDHLTIANHNYSRSLNEKPLIQEYPNRLGVWPNHIDGFREKLRQTFLHEKPLS